MDIKRLLDEKLLKNKFTSSLDKEKNILRYENKDSRRGVNLDLNKLKPRFEKEGQKAIDEIAYYIEKSIIASSKKTKLDGNTNLIFPIIRSKSFPKTNSKGVQLVTKEHTSESVIYYALDLGAGYQLIDQALLTEAGLSLEALHEFAMSNLKSVEFTFKLDSVAGNQFYFINQNDGFDASRILLTSFLDEMKSTFEGTMAVAIPHQDVLILCDIRNDHGYNILAEMNMKFFTNGNVPITALSFIYDEKELEPIFIMK